MKERIDWWGFDRTLMTWWERNLHWVIPIGAATVILLPPFLGHVLLGL